MAEEYMKSQQEESQEMLLPTAQTENPAPTPGPRQSGPGVRTPLLPTAKLADAECTATS